MTVFAGESLITSLHHRTHALGSYIGSLRAATSGAAEPFRAALDLISQYATLVRVQADRLYSREADEAGRLEVLSPLLADLLHVERRVDQLFARSHQLDVPRSLVRAVGKELMAVGVGDLEAVLTIGPPGNYETSISDLYDFLFLRTQLRDSRAANQKTVTMISLPYIEGTRALWLPVAVGHEVAHLALHTRGLLAALDVDSWLDESHLSGVKEPPPWLAEDLTILPGMQNTLSSWVTELVCDLYAVYRFGPAGAAAQSEFLAAIGSANVELESHPPGAYRATAMADSLPMMHSEMAQLASTWRSWGAEQLEKEPPEWKKVLLSRIDDHLGQMRDLAKALVQTPYDLDQRQTIVDHVAERLEQNLPGAETVAGETVTDADVLNAGWKVRHKLNYVRDRKKREVRAEALDTLVGKAIDTLDFVEMWHTAAPRRRRPPRTSTGSPTAIVAGNARGGVVPATEILRRLDECRDVPLATVKYPLVLTPLLDGAAAGTGIDVRLSRTFITFKRSSTASFDVLDEHQDPREIQEVVEKDWGRTFILHPGELVLAATLEYLVLPADLSAQVITRSSYGRLGLLSATAVQVHPHFHGCLTLELVNLGQMPLTLTPGQRIAQLIFSTVDPPAKPSAIKYVFPVGPQFSKARSDDDVRVLAALRRASRTKFR